MRASHDRNRLIRRARHVAPPATARLTLAVSMMVAGCATLDQPPAREARREVPEAFDAAPAGPTIAAQQHWDQFFADPNLRALIEAALANSQELNIRLQEIIVAKNEAAGLTGDYLPRLGAQVGGGLEKVGAHTSQGVSDEAHEVPEHLPDFRFGLVASWEIDAWGKLRNAAKAAGMRYAATVEGKNFLITEIIAELADAYYELVALDRQLDVLTQNIALQERALEVVQLEKAAGRATELAVRRFEAEVLKNQGRRFDLEQLRVQTENRINMLVGRFPQPVQRDARMFEVELPECVQAGLPSALLDNRPDVRRAQLELEATKLDVEVAKARFYPALSIEAEVGYQSFNAKHLLETPASIFYNIVGNLTAPLLNRRAIEADYRVANAEQIQAVFDFERTLLVAYTEVANQLSSVRNQSQRYQLITKQVETLKKAIDVSIVLYRSARAEYMEVLMTRRDALEAEIELIEARKAQLRAMVKIYQALGGGWQPEAAPAAPSADDPQTQNRESGGA